MSSTENYQNSDILGFSADEAITAGYAVKLSATGVELCDTAGEASDGVSLDTVTAAGDEVGVIEKGIVKVVAGTGGFSAADNLAVENTGKYVTATTGQVVVAIALEDAAADAKGRAKLLPRGQFTAA